MNKEQRERLRAAAEKATPGPWLHVNAYKTVPAARTVHGTVPGQRVDYVSTWDGPGTPAGHRVVIDMDGRERAPRSDDMAYIAEANPAAVLALLDALDAAEARAEQLDGSAGWLYVSDDGVEWSADHPVWSGQVPDALDIRADTRSALLIELWAAWEVRAEVAASSAAAESRATAAEARVAVLEGLLREAGEVVGELLQHSIAHYGHPRDEDYGVGLYHTRARAILAQGGEA